MGKINDARRRAPTRTRSPSTETTQQGPCTRMSRVPTLAALRSRIIFSSSMSPARQDAILAMRMQALTRFHSRSSSSGNNDDGKFTPEEIASARVWLAALNETKLPPDGYFDISYARSSGPGGQNVNKVETKATVKLPASVWRHAHWIPAPVLAQLTGPQSTFPYTTSGSGNLVIQSDRSRSRATNLRDCYEKLVAGIKQAVYFAPEPEPENTEKWVKIKKATNEKRLKAKQKRGDKKQSRRRNFDD